MWMRVYVWEWKSICVCMCVCTLKHRQIYTAMTPREIFLTSRSWRNFHVNILRSTVRRDEAFGCRRPERRAASAWIRDVICIRGASSSMADGRRLTTPWLSDAWRERWTVRNSWASLSSLEDRYISININCYINTYRAEFCREMLHKLEDDFVGRKFVPIVSSDKRSFRHT